jgi:hypothetical protein
MEKIKEAGAGLLSVILLITEFASIDVLNKFLAAGVSVCLIIYYLKKIFSKNK